MLKKSTAKVYRYIRFRKGFGVHSPFAFGLINKVIEEKKPYYAFEEIETLLSQNLQSKNYSVKYGRLLFRLIHFFRSQSVLQIGISNGVSSLYLNAAAKQLLVLDDNEECIKKAVALNELRKPLHVMHGEYLSSIGKIFSQSGDIDVIYLNVSKNAELTQMLFEKSLPHIHPQTICIIDGIHKKRMEPVWKQIKQRQDIPITMDLYALGLVFFDRKMYKKNYKIFF